jgi:predicted nuclease of predicted toxin-antitoxin system
MHGKTDDAVFEFAIGQDRIVITANCSDFQELAAVRLSKGEHHPGILCIFLYNNPHKDMSNTARVKSINNMEKTGVAVHDTVIVLNKYNY